MVWFFFVRGHEVLRLEARLEARTGDYVLTIDDCDGIQQTRRFRDAAAFRRSLMHEEERLEAECWRRTCLPVVISGTDRQP
jgi:hypothetical protein